MLEILAAVLLVFLILAGFVALVVVRGLQTKELCHAGVRAQGRVVEKQKLPPRNAGSRRFVIYEYPGPDGRTYRHRMAVTVGEFNRLEEGDEIAIVILPHKPAVSGTLEMVNQARGALKLPPL